MENEIDNEIEIEILENGDKSSKTHTTSKSVRFSSDEKRSNHPQKIVINEKSKDNSSDLFPVESMLTAEIKPYSDPFKFDDFSSNTLLTNTSDRVQFETVLNNSSTNNAWRFARRPTIPIIPLNSELEQQTEIQQNPQPDPHIYEDYRKQNPSVFNFNALHDEILKEGEFVVQKYLGSGSYGVVLKVQSRDSGEIQAMKVYSADPDDVGSFKERLAEMKVLKNVSHVNILPYYGFRKYKSHLGILLKFVDDGTLRDLMDARPISEELAANFTSQIVRGLDYLHRKDCIHRDIKPSNILITSIGVIKIADFGSSKFLNDRSTFNATHATTIKGTLMYLAPEVIQRSEYRKECDIWGLGSVIFEMMTNKRICEEKTRVGIYKWKRDMKNKLVLPDGLSELSKDIMSKCLEINPAKRPSCDQLFKHEWFQEQGSFERWELVQKLLEDDSDCKQNEAELAQEALKQQKEETFCDKVGKKRHQLFGALITIVTVVAIVAVGIKVTTRSATNAKKLIPIATTELPDPRLPLDQLKNSTEIEERPKKKLQTEPRELALIQKDPAEKRKGQEERDDTNISEYSSKWPKKWISIFSILVGVGSLLLVCYFWRFGIPESLKSMWKKEKIPSQDQCTFKEYMAKSFKPVCTIDEGVRNGVTTAVDEVVRNGVTTAVDEVVRNGVTTAVDEVMWKKAKIGRTSACKFGIPERVKSMWTKAKIPFQDQCKFSSSSCTFEEYMAKIDEGVRHGSTTTAAGEGLVVKLLRHLAKDVFWPVFTYFVFCPGVAILCLLCLHRLGALRR